MPASFVASPGTPDLTGQQAGVSEPPGGGVDHHRGGEVKRAPWKLGQKVCWLPTRSILIPVPLMTHKWGCESPVSL